MKPSEQSVMSHDIYVYPGQTGCEKTVTFCIIHFVLNTSQLCTNMQELHIWHH